MMTQVRQSPDPIDLCNLIACETVALLYGTDKDGVDCGKALRAGLETYASVCGLEEEVKTHLVWIDSDLDCAERSADTGEDTPRLLDLDCLPDTPSAAMLTELLWGLFQAAVRVEDAEKRGALLELARTVTDLGGLEDKVLYGFEPDENAASYERYRECLEEAHSALNRVKKAMEELLPEEPLPMAMGES